MNRLNKILKLIPLILPILLLLVALPFSLWKVINVNQKQTYQGKASTSTGTATLSIDPTTSKVYAGETVPINLRFFNPVPATYGDAGRLGIIGIKAVLNYTNSDAFSLSPSDITTPLSSPWSYIRKEVATDATSKTTYITIEAIYPEPQPTGYMGANTVPQIFAVLNLKSNSQLTQSASSTLTFDRTKSAIYAKLNNLDILSDQSITMLYTYDVLVDRTPPETTIITQDGVHITEVGYSINYTGTDSPSPPSGTPTNELTYSFQTDGNAWSTFTSNTSFYVIGYPRGQHTFSVRARDKAGNVDPTPATIIFYYEPAASIELTLKFQGLDDHSLHLDKELDVTLKNSTGSPTLASVKTVAKYDQTKRYPNGYIAQIPLPNTLPEGYYHLVVKGPSHLAKAWNDIHVGIGVAQVYRTSASDELIRGDVLNDNIIQMSDITQTLSVATASEVPVTPQLQKYDLDENGLITISDITAIISNATASQVYGDN
jgi:hypothetical protein